MAIAFRGTGATASGNTPASLTFAAPSGTVSTDVVLIFICFLQATQNDAAPTITPPSGWTQALVLNDIINSFLYVIAYWGLGSASFGAWSFTGATEAVIGWAQGYTGVDNTTPMDVTATGQTKAAGTVWTAPSITTVTDNAWLVGFFSGWQSTANETFSSEFGTHRKNDNFTDSFANITSIDSADSAQAIAGASGTKSVTASTASTNNNIGVLMALRPAAAVSVFDDGDFRSLQLPILEVNVSLW